DPHIPLLLWWAIEDKAIADREQVLGLLDSSAWRQPLMNRYIVERLARRYMAEGSDTGYAACARLLAAAPTAADADLLITGMEKALEGRTLEKVPPALDRHLADLWKRPAPSVTLIRFALRLGSREAFERALQRAGDDKVAAAERVALIDVLGQAGKPECVA